MPWWVRSTSGEPGTRQPLIKKELRSTTNLNNVGYFGVIKQKNINTCPVLVCRAHILEDGLREGVTIPFITH